MYTYIGILLLSLSTTVGLDVNPSGMGNRVASCLRLLLLSLVSEYSARASGL